MAVTVDVSQIVSAIQTAAAPIALIAGAVLVVLATLAVWRWVNASIDEYGAAMDAENEDDVEALYESGGAFVCEQCDYELDEDEAYHAIDAGYCPKCGNEVS